MRWSKGANGGGLESEGSIKTYGHKFIKKVAENSVKTEVEEGALDPQKQSGSK